MSFVQGIRDTRKFFDEFHVVMFNAEESTYVMKGDLIVFLETVKDEYGDDAIKVGDVYRCECDQGGVDTMLVRLRDGELTIKRDMCDANYHLVGGPIHSLIAKYAVRPATEGIITYPLHDRDDSIIREYDLSKAFKHPRSDTMKEQGIVVHDILHPCMRLYQTSLAGKFCPKRTNRFGKAYIDSNHQWVPHSVTISPDGAKIELGPDLAKNPELCSYLEQLLPQMMPGFRQTYQYLESLTRPDGDDAFPFEYFSSVDKVCNLEDIDIERGQNAHLPHRLQFYLKVVDIEIPEDTWYEGVWHLEGMPQEHIIATGIYYLDIMTQYHGLQSPHIVFKREYQCHEHNYLHSIIGQGVASTVHDMMANYMPLGSLETKGGHAVFFPNTHIHRVQPFYNNTLGTIHRQFVVFFLVDPEVTLPDFGTVKSEDIVDSIKDMDVLTENMKTRMICKENLNPREINFCEH